MKNQVLRRGVLWGAISFFIALTIFALPRIAHLQAADDVPASSTKKGAKEPTGKHINFDEPRQLDLGAQAASTQPVALVSADFDSDGFADIVTADSAGGLELLKGIDPANFAFDPNTGEAARPEPFSAARTGASLGFPPDFLFAGDYNADGKQDILGAAKGANALVVVIGDGHGNFSPGASIGVGGSITAIESGEIGRVDGQADVAVTFSNKNGNFLAVFEHPESAFKHAPEIIKLPSAASTITIGNMDEDFYSDIAVACGPTLVIIHERGQVYPWDAVKDSGISRPPAIVETRRMPFSIVTMTVGRFGGKRGTSLALLGGDGSLHALEPMRTAKGSINTAVTPQLPNLRGLPFAPTDTDTTRYALLAVRSGNQFETSDAMGNPLIDYDEMKSTGRDRYLRKREDEAVDSAKQLSPDEIARTRAESAAKNADSNLRQKKAFLRSIAPTTSPVRDWRLETISAGSKLAAFAAGNQARISRVNVSDSDLDDLMLTQTGGAEIQFVSRRKDETGQMRAEIHTVSTGAGTAKVLPLRLNLDAIDDLVVLSSGASAPSVVMSAPSAVFFVNTTNDSAVCVSGGECSLRGAIIEANGNPGSDIIGFALPGGSVISPQSQLPSITGPISIQGYTLPNGTKAIEISGVNAGSPVDGLKIRSSNSFIYNLAVNGFKGTIVNGGQIGGNGVVVASDSGAPNIGNNQISICFVGTDPTGNIDSGNDGAGVLIFDSDTNSVVNNVISGNGTGIGVTDGNTNSFTGNIIGLNAAGNAKLGNSAGIVLTGSSNTVGGDQPGAGNTVSGNGIPDPNAPGQCRRSYFYFASGIATETLVDLSTGAFLTLNNTLKGNFVGTGTDGSQPLGNCYGGILTSPLHQTTIGSIAQTGRNVVADNGLGAIACSEEIFFDVEGGFCAIAGNNIGTDVTGTVPIPNNDRNYEGGVDRGRGTVDIFHNLTVSYFGAPGGNLPNSCAGFCNLYSSNNPGVFEGIYFTGRGAIGFFNNYIGTNQQGNQALGNTSSSAIEIGNSLDGPVYVGGIGTDENGAPVELGNVISGNANSAVRASTFGTVGFSSPLIVQGNRIGTDATGNVAIPNSNNGDPNNSQPAIIIGRAFTEPVFVGGADHFQRNIVSGNLGTGILLSGSSPTIVANNLIGVDIALNPLGNAGIGLAILGSDVDVGGSVETANEIAFNGNGGGGGQPGIFVGGFGSRPAVGVSVRGNSVHDNGGLGIDLGVRDPRPAFNTYVPDGVTLNDYCSLDADSGANQQQNFPELFAPTANMDGTINVEGFLRSSPYGTFQVDLYSNSTADPTGHGEGETYLGSRTITTDGNGFGSFVFQSATAIPPTTPISATATDNLGNTSEFSCNAGVTCDGLRKPANLREYLALPQEACPASIKVNLSGDEPDGNLADGFCDIDTSNNDNHECTLRAALQNILQDGYVGTHTIGFEIPGQGVHLITTTGLPAITKYVIIDGESQPGYVDKPLIEIRGSGPAAGTGLIVRTSGSTIKGLAFNNFFDHAIHLDGGSDNRIQACFIGVAADGITPGPDLQTSTGIFIQNSHDNTIGGGDARARNVIAHVYYGIYVSGGRRNNLFNNYVGVNATGQTALGNNGGVLINGSSDNVIGKKLDVDGNVISGNLNGIEINADSSNTVISGNYIGTDATGMSPIGNIKDGVVIESGAANNKVGTGLGAFSRNIISGQTFFLQSGGVRVDRDAGPNNSVTGNFIGLNKDGTAKIANNVGVTIFADRQRVGESGNYPNVVSGNNEIGILVTAPQDSPNQVVDDTIIDGNIVGTDFNKTSTTLGNPKLGIALLGQVKKATVRENTVGGNGVGVYVGGTAYSVGPSENTFKNNGIGLTIRTLNATPLPNYVGLWLRGASNNTVMTNTVSANRVFGMILGAVIDDEIAGQPPPNMNQSTTQNKLIDNRIGTDDVGFTGFGNGKIGLVVGDYANNNCIGSCTGGLTGGYGNVISSQNSADGIGILLGSLSTTAPPANWPTGNQFRDNIVGMNRDLSGCLPNLVGMLISKAGGNQIGVRVGNFKHGNVFNCNPVHGISVKGETNGETIVEANWIGVTPNGQNFPNNTSGGIGIYYTTETRKVWIKDTVIGGQKYGVYAVQTQNNRPATPLGSLPPPIVQVTGSLIGVFRDLNGTLIPVGNEIGIFAESASRVLIGKLSAEPGPKNIVSGNTEDGIRIIGGGGNQINNTIIGTDETGADTIGNGGDGLEIMDSTANVVTGVTIGGNSANGVMVQGGDNNMFIGNNIGIAEQLIGSTSVANQLAGMHLLQTTQNQILLLNKIAANGGAGLLLQDATQTTVRNNLIGTDGNNTPNLGNGGDGILINDNSRLNIIGGPESDAGNTITANGGSGVRLDSSAGHCNMIDPNKIYGNTGLGIDLGTIGHTPNDAGDADEGPNRMQNYPQINSWQIDVNGDLLVDFKVDSLAANSSYGASGIYVEFFESDLSGEGERFIGSNYWTLADLANGGKVVNLGNAAGLGIAQGDLVTASATDADGNTSEFFPPLVPTAAGVTVEGRVLTADGRPVWGARLTLAKTDGTSRTVISNHFGRYRFDDVEVGQTYVLTISSRRFIFENPTRLVYVADTVTDADFEAAP